MPFPRACKNCGRDFTVRCRFYKGSYCSEKCKGEHYRIIRTGDANTNWKGGVKTAGNDYPSEKNSTHPRSNAGYVLKHILVAEAALGRLLPEAAQVHHVNRDRTDSSNANLVICQDCSYHHLIHVRTRVLEQGGNPNMDKICCICKVVKPITEFFKDKSKFDGLCTKCKACAQEYRLRTSKRRS